MWLAFTHVGGKYSPPCQNGAPSTLSASLWSGLRYQICLIEERPFLFNFRSKRLSFFLHLDVFLSFLKFAAIPRISAYGFPQMDFRGWSFLLFSGLRFPHEVRPRQLLCWRWPRWFSTSSDLWLFSLEFPAIPTKHWENLGETYQNLANIQQPRETT